MKKKRQYQSQESLFRKIEAVLQDGGVGGLTVAQVAKRLGMAKSYIWTRLQQMVDYDLIGRQSVYSDATEVSYTVRYFYFQLPMFTEEELSERAESLPVSTEEMYANEEGWE